jgi:excisionase family DNA binding protein
MSEQLLRPADIAEILQVSKALAYQILARGEIPCVRFGKTIRVRKEDLDKYIYENVGKNSNGETNKTTGAEQ